MFGLPKNSIINVPISIDKLFNNYDFNTNRKKNIKRKIKSLCITNQIECKEFIDKKSIERNIYFIQLVFYNDYLNADDLQSYEDSDYINEGLIETKYFRGREYIDKKLEYFICWNFQMLKSIYENINRDAFFVIADENDTIKAVFYKDLVHFDYLLLDNYLELEINIENKEFREQYKALIKQMEEYEEYIQICMSENDNQYIDMGDDVDEEDKTDFTEYIMEKDNNR